MVLRYDRYVTDVTMHFNYNCMWNGRNDHNVYGRYKFNDRYVMVVIP